MRALASFWCALALALWAGAVSAQSSSDGAINYELWEDLATLSETAVDQQSETTETFEGLRTRVATFRTQFSKARDANDDRIAALREQLDAGLEH